MSSFYEKLSMKLQGSDGPEGDGKEPAASKAVTYRATGDRAAAPPPKQGGASEALPPADAIPEGSDPIDVDLFQSDSRMVIFMQVSGVSAGGFSLTISEESNTLTVEAAQKRPNLPPIAPTKEGEPAEKGIYAKAEIKWKSLYRKIYLPAAFDASGATAVLENGVLMITLPAKHPGAGKKLTVQEVRNDEHKQ